jgi:hypothetical protein
VHTRKGSHNKKRVTAFIRHYNDLNTKGHHPIHYALYNECSHTVKDCCDCNATHKTEIQNHGITKPWVHTAEHRHKAAKYNTIAPCYTIEPSCSIQLLERSMPQIEATLGICYALINNNTRSTYTISVYVHLTRIEDYWPLLVREHMTSLTLTIDYHGSHIQMIPIYFNWHLNTNGSCNWNQLTGKCMITGIYALYLACWKKNILEDAV